ITRAVGTHLAVQAAIAIDDHNINHSVLGASQAIPQHEQTRRLRRDPPTEDDVRNAIERATVSAKRIEIVLSESIVAAARSSSAWAKRSNPYEQCERIGRRTTLGQTARSAALSIPKQTFLHREESVHLRHGSSRSRRGP